MTLTLLDAARIIALQAVMPPEAVALARSALGDVKLVAEAMALQRLETPEA